MKKCWSRLGQIITYMMVVSLLSVCLVPVSVHAAETENKSATTDDRILGMSSEATTLNKGDVVELKFAIQNTETFGFFGYLDYDTEVFETLEAGELLPCSYSPEDMDNQGSWIASYSPTSKSIEVRWRGPKAVTLPEDTKGVVLTIKLMVKQSTETTKVRLDYPKVYKSNENTDSISYPSGLEITLKNNKIKKLVLATTDVNVTGSTVSVPVSCSTNEGFVSLDLVTEFDKTKLQYQSVSVEAALKNYVTVDSYSTDQSGNKIITHIKASQEVKNIGGLFTVNFTAVKPSGTAQTGGSVTDTVKLSVENVKDQSESAFETSGASSKVSVKFEATLSGDINGNKKIDLVDALYIVQYYNKVRYFTEEQKAVADVNKSGTVDLVDALLVMQYYNGVIKNFP